ncbi:hypothetical protein MRB53_013960 [Persea americana]|uniref:Uncharacterized protein n=1 Tax=Persea americana TaxID=3435 RepID=A0ACC2K9Z0_PERAE|nr:hypothetical protein MRB53_013960 [Persea americana]
MLQADFRSALHFAAAVCYLNPVLPPPPPGGGGACFSSSTAIWKRTKTKRNHIFYSNSVSMSPFFFNCNLEKACSVHTSEGERGGGGEEAIIKEEESVDLHGGRAPLHSRPRHRLEARSLALSPSSKHLI